MGVSHVYIHLQCQVCHLLLFTDINLDSSESDHILQASVRIGLDTFPYFQANYYANNSGMNRILEF